MAKIARIRIAGIDRTAFVRDDEVFVVDGDLDVVGVVALPKSERDALEATALAAPGSPVAETEFLAPVQPPAMRDFLSFQSHVDAMEKSAGAPGVPEEWFDQPVFLFMAPHAVTGPYDDVKTVPGTECLDFELEIAALIARDVHNVYPEQAHDAIGGYLVMNDWSARDIQGKEMKLRLGPSKGKDFATTIGPWVVTADELEPHRNSEGFLDLRMTVSVNGVQLAEDSSANMGWTFEELVSHGSRYSWVKAGEVLGSGTCAYGALSEPWARTGSLTPPPLRPGDVVEMTIEGIGTIRNRVVENTDDVPPVPRGRRRF